MNSKKKKSWLWPGNLMALFLIALGVTITIWTWSAHQKEQTNYSRTIVNQTAYSFKNYFLARLENDLMALKRMALRGASQDYDLTEAWQEDGLTYLQDIPGLMALYWISQDLNLKTELSLKGHVELNLNEHFSQPEFQEFYKQPVKERRPLLSPVISSGHEKKIFFIIIPAPASEKAQTLFLIAAISLEDLLKKEAYFLDDLKNYRVSIQMDKQALYNSEPIENIKNSLRQ